mmetsp:Transcript_81886/g.230489  ORF Transcript_81886/g.230489 Transcript_81886/m.230489 type:complete len:220 (-) Transcript_81886:43-702(-)
MSNSLVCSCRSSLHVRQDRSRRRRLGIGTDCLCIGSHLRRVHVEGLAEGVEDFLARSDTTSELVVAAHESVVVSHRAQCKDRIVLEAGINDGQVSVCHEVDQEGPVHRKHWWLRVLLVECVDRIRDRPNRVLHGAQLGARLLRNYTSIPRLRKQSPERACCEGLRVLKVFAVAPIPGQAQEHCNTEEEPRAPPRRTSATTHRCHVRDRDDRLCLESCFC